MSKRNFRKQNEEEIQAYLAQHKLNAQKSETGLYYYISKQGEGVQAKKDSNLAIRYIGYFCNGEIFDQSELLEINLKDVIAGWTEGISYFKEGGEGILFIPAHLGYGNTDYASIPGGSVLIFDIQLLHIQSTK
jgi:FKBP-type peptidyl-prolyl cis-trans isomerase FkpA